jgi:hypothetical protein
MQKVGLGGRFRVRVLGLGFKVRGERMFRLRARGDRMGY